MHCKTYEASKFCVPAANVNVLLAWPAYQSCTVLKSVHWISVDPIDPLHPLRQAKLPSPNKVPWARALALQIEASLQASRWVNSTCTMRNGTFNYDQNAGQQTYPFTNYSSNSFKLSIYYITTQVHRVQKNTRASNTPCSTIMKRNSPHCHNLVEGKVINGQAHALCHKSLLPETFYSLPNMLCPLLPLAFHHPICNI